MSIGAVSATVAADRGLAAPAARSRKAEREPAVAPPDLYAATTTNSQTLIAALGQNAAEAKRLNNLVAAAQAAAVRVVTEPLETASTETVRSVSELLDGVRFRQRSAGEEPDAAPQRKRASNAPTVRDPASNGPPSPNPSAQNPAGALTSPQQGGPAGGPPPFQPPADDVPPAAPQPPQGGDAGPPPSSAEPPAPAAPAGPQPPVAQEPAPQEPPAAPPAPPPSAATPSGGLGGTLGTVVPIVGGGTGGGGAGGGGLLGGILGRR